MELNFYFRKQPVCLFIFILSALLSTFNLNGQINFTISQLNGTSLTNPTSLQFGPDGRLYVAQQNGIIKVFTVTKNASNNYSVTATETITLINQIPNYNDDGSLAPSVTTRQVTGILVTGTAAQPLLYVTSSDSRVGGDDLGGDLNLDTNSGILSLLSWNGSAWIKVDLIRGFPRSEENHSVNGMQLNEQNNTLYMAVGGITNAGAPSHNFGYTNEYALSAVILSIDLNVINAMPVQGSGNTAYKYDLPTLDDPTRTNSGGKDNNDPFGGNDGLNQAKIVVGGPVQIYSPGFRNAYDLVLTKTPGNSGRLYTIDNGANQGWGGYPENEGPAGNVTNNYVPGEPGSTGPGVNELQVNNLDKLNYIGNVNSYQPGSYYGGHPCPIRANPGGAGLYTHNGSTGVWRTSTTGANPLPADWPPVPVANAVEGDFLMPGSINSQSLLTFISSTNGITEYTASFFNNAMKGNLLAVDYAGNLWRIVLTPDGTAATNNKSSVTKTILDAPLAANFGAVPLDIITQGDNDAFPGTIWVAMYMDNSIKILEPNVLANCTGLDNNIDDDNDGFTNADEIDNGTDPCSAASRPADFDQDKVSDLNDTDDDNDGINDNIDYFAIDSSNGLATYLPVQYSLLNNNPGTGFFGLGFTGLMSNKQPSNDYLKLFDQNNLIAGGTAGVLSIVAVSPKDALGAVNNQENAFQFGVNVSTSTGPFKVNARILGPFFSNQTPTGDQSQGMYIGTGDQSNYIKIALNANNGQPGIQVIYENNDVPVTNQYTIPGGISGTSTIDLYLSVNPLTGIIQPKYALNGGAIVDAGAPVQVSGSLFNTIQGTAALAIGIISTSLNGSPFTASWDYINVTIDPVNTIWTTVAPSHTPKWVGFSVMYNNKMYVFSGFDNPEVHTTPKVEVYDPVTDTWNYLADMPSPVTHAGITIDSDKIYVAGGFLGGLAGDPNSNLLQIYNITTNTWSNGPNLPAKSGGNALVRVGKQLHSFGGLLEDRQTGAPDHFVLDLNNPGNGWTNAATIPMPRCHFATACVAGKIYAFGGQTGHDGPYQDVNYVQVYDPSTDIWTRLKDMPYPRSHSEPATFVMDGKVYLTGGRTTGETIIDKVTYYDPATDTWTEDIPLPAGVTLFGPAAEVIGNEIFVSNGGLNTCCAPQTTTRKRGINRAPNLKIGFLPSSFDLSAPANSNTSKNAVLWTLSGAPVYTINTSGLPSWLSVTPATGTIDLLGGTEIKVTGNTATLAPGNYSAAITAKAPGYPDALLQINLTVTPANQKVLYLYGQVPPGEVDMKLSDVGSTGMSQFSSAIQQAGFTPFEALDAAITLDANTLNQYKVLILGSNNRRFSTTEQTAVATWVNAGGGLIAWSDAAFGWQNGGINSTAGHLSDNDLTQQFGMQFLRDNGSAAFTLNQWTTDHYINNFNKNAGITIKAEGVSPVRTNSPATILASIPSCCAQLNTLDGQITPADAALSIAKIGQGRVVGYFDRNAFWNAGDGTRLSEVDNKVFAQRLILWASGINDSLPVNTNTYRTNAGGPQVSNSIGTFTADQFFSPAPGETYSVTTAIAGTNDDAIYQTERYATTDNGSFSYAFPVSNGSYTVILHFAETYWTASGKRKFDVSIENNLVLNNYDIFQKVGAFTATKETFTVNVTDGVLSINFNGALADGGIDRPKISAIEILPSAVNQLPIANAGPDQTITLPTNSVTLNGSGTDADGTIAGYAWAKISGSGTITNSTAATTTITGLTEGVSIFQLVVTDDQGAASAADQITITVNPASLPTVYRINAGGAQVSNSMGTFAADQFFSPAPGLIYTTTTAIAGTNDDAIYQSERYSPTDNGSFNYAFPISNGTYSVVLHFAEIYWAAIGKRKFDVNIENNLVLNDYDIFKKAGAFTATTETFTVTVTDSVLNIHFSSSLSTGGIDRPKVSAIEILPSSGNQLPIAFAGPDMVIVAPANSVTVNGSGTDVDGTIVGYTWTKVSGSGTVVSPSSATAIITNLTEGVSVFQLVVTDNLGAVSAADLIAITVNAANTTIIYRINAGGPTVSNSIGTFAADLFFSPSPGITYSTTTSIAGTNDDAIYQTERYSTTDNGSFSYAFPVNNDTYTVVLHFAEIYWNAPGKRKFDVSIENNLVLNDYDIFQKVGIFTGTTETLVVSVTDGTLNIDFSSALAVGGIDRPKVSAIEILKPNPLNRITFDFNDEVPSKVIPNPTTDGKIIILPYKIFLGQVYYTLMSSSGNLLKKGQLPPNDSRSLIYFDFSREMLAAGVYYLHLWGQNKKTVLKILRQ